MATPDGATERPCLYCGGPTPGVRRGEHVIPKALGGRVTISRALGRPVCTGCNTGVLSGLDRELCSRSYLALVASQEIEGDVWQVWDVDHAAGNLLLEAEPVWAGQELSSLVTYPQMTFEPGGPELRGDAEQVERFGREDFRRVFVRAARLALHRHWDGEKRVLHLERTHVRHLTPRYRFAPRLFARSPIAEIAGTLREQSFVLRFAEAGEVGRSLAALNDLDPVRPFRRWKAISGSHRPAIVTEFDLTLVVRALFKIGFNLLAEYCPHTPVGRDRFTEVIGIIRGEIDVSRETVERNGFVEPCGVQDIAQPGCHSFRLLHDGGRWFVFSSFFGGRVCARVDFEGPSCEAWKTLTIRAPIGSPRWTTTPSPLYLPCMARVVLNDSNKIIPSIPIQVGATKLTAAYVPRRRS